MSIPKPADEEVNPEENSGSKKLTDETASKKSDDGDVIKPKRTKNKRSKLPSSESEPEKISIDKKEFKEDNDNQPSESESIGKRSLRKRNQQRAVYSGSDKEEEKKVSSDGDYTQPVSKVPEPAKPSPKKRGRPKGSKNGDSPKPKKIQKTNFEVKSKSVSREKKQESRPSADGRDSEKKNSLLYGVDEEFKLPSDADEAEEEMDLNDEDLEVENDTPNVKSSKVKSETGDKEQLKLPDNVFIDNLPKEKSGIQSMLKDVNNNIRRLEIQFFEEEDSENDMFFEKTLLNPAISSQEHN